jgi:hypothetical protein
MLGVGRGSALRIERKPRGLLSVGGPGGGAGGHATPSNKLTFLRGHQVSDPAGQAVFETIYPGWYRGRAPHIHLKVHVGGSVIHTGQLFFADSTSDAVYRTSHYKSHGQPDTTDARDSIYKQAGASSAVVKLTRATGGNGFVGRDHARSQGLKVGAPLDRDGPASSCRSNRARSKCPANPEVWCSFPHPHSRVEVPGGEGMTGTTWSSRRRKGPSGCASDGLALCKRAADPDPNRLVGGPVFCVGDVSPGGGERRHLRCPARRAIRRCAR